MNKKELDSGFPILIDKTIKGIRVLDGKMLIIFECGEAVQFDKNTLKQNTKGIISKSY